MNKLMNKTKGMGNGRFLKEGIQNELIKKQNKNIKNLKEWEFKLYIGKKEHIIKGDGVNFEIKNIDELVLFLIISGYVNQGLKDYLNKALDKLLEEGIE